MMKTKLTILQTVKLLGKSSLRLEKLLTLSRESNSRTLLPLMYKANSLALGRIERLRARIRITSNYLQALLKIQRHHGLEFTLKWTKANHVALQKYLGGDPVKSLRSLEPCLPLPRLINGCPAIINSRDRKLMREGNQGVQRFWLTQFGLYRIWAGPSQAKIETIYAPFKGCMETLLSMISWAKLPGVNPFRLLKLPEPDKLAPYKMVLSHKASPSNSASFRGVVTDYFLMRYDGVNNHMKGTNPYDRSPTVEWNNLMGYLDLLKENRHPTTRFRQLLSGLDNLGRAIYASPGCRLPFKCTAAGTGLSQFSIKLEPAGKVRVFALLDSLTQSALAPVHDFLFSVLKLLPNDGTFDQDASVARAKEKHEKYGISYSFDLSSATDRLPRKLTASILEALVKIPGFGDKWEALIANRVFSFSSSIETRFPHLYEDQGNKYTYSVGQPMGGLSSWAGLAITHHWILQYCSRRRDWEDRYEILGDDIVIFDKDLAETYLKVMEALGVDINISKSINSSLQGFEFAKRTFINGVNVSAISVLQIMSSISLNARVADAHSWVTKGLVRNVSHLGALLSARFSNKAFRDLKLVGLAALSFLNLLASQKTIELRIVLESLVNPRYEDFDWEKSSFDLPLRSILKYILEVLSGKNPTYPFSKESDRNEVFRELEPGLVDIILQEALVKSKKLSQDYDRLLNKGSSLLYLGKPSKLVKAQFAGFFQDMIENVSDLDPILLAEECHDLLYMHAKRRNVEVDEALRMLEQVDNTVFRYTFRLSMSRVKYVKDTSSVLQALRKNQGLILIPYWQVPIGPA